MLVSLGRPPLHLDHVVSNAVSIRFQDLIRSGITMANMVSMNVNRVYVITHATVGLIRWKIVIHAFVDGFSRFVLGILASNNNRATTVLQLFEDIALEFGYPSRVRGDHGSENVLVAAQMEEIRGVGRGSYIWGR